MKNCKKIALLVIVFLLSSVLNVNAADYAETSNVNVTLTPSATQIKAGETVTVTLSAKCDTGIEGIDSTLEYDKTKLQFTEAAAKGFTSMSGEDGTGNYKLSVLYTDSAAAPTEANFVTLTFEALDTVTVDETLSVKLTGIEVGDSDDEWFTVADKEVTLTVVGEEQTPDDGEQTPDDGEQTPDDGEQTPDDGEQTPDDGEQTPEDGEQTPDDGEQTPEDGEQTPEDGEQTPEDGEQKPADGEEKDPTIADKPMNNAGASNVAFVVIAGMVIVAIVFYAKCKKYKDVK